MSSASPSPPAPSPESGVRPSAHDKGVIEFLLDLRADPNDKPDCGSSALDACIRCLGWEDFDRVRCGYGSRYLAPASKVPRIREAVRLLVERGAMWSPDLSTLNATQRILYRLEPDLAAEPIGLLLSGAGGEDAARELLRVPRMREHVAPCAGRLARLGLTIGIRPRAAPRPILAGPARLSADVLAMYDRDRLYAEVWSKPTRRPGARDIHETPPAACAG